MRRWKRVLPPIVSIALVYWVVSTVSWERLKQAFAELNWQVLVLLTFAQLMAAFFYDSFCLWWLFNDRERPLSYRAALQARGYSYLGLVVHYGLGQGLLVWCLAKAQNSSVAPVVWRCLMFAYVDICVLLFLGLVGATAPFAAATGPVAAGAREVAIICGLGLVLMLALGVAVRLLPASWKTRLAQTKWAWCVAWDWQVKHLFQLFVLRQGYYVLALVYASLALWACQIHVDPAVLLSGLAIMALANGLPISVAGIGTREAALLTFIPTDRPDVLVAFSLFWSVFSILCRSAIGLVTLWYAPAPPREHERV